MCPAATYSRTMTENSDSTRSGVRERAMSSLHAFRQRADQVLRSSADSVSDSLEARITSVTSDTPKAQLNTQGRAALALADAATWASKKTGRGSGGMIGGMIAAAIDPMIMGRTNASRPVALVTGTNGKSTTTRMLAAAARTAFTTATNEGGDNMDAGVVSALRAGGDYDVATLEVDEMHVPAIADKLDPQVLVLLNLSRDQLDRVGEINSIERALRGAVNKHPDMTVVANCDDVMVTSAAWDSPNVVWVSAGLGWQGESTSCPRPGGAIIRREVSDTTAADSTDSSRGSTDASAAGSSSQPTDHVDWYAAKPLPDGSEFRRPSPDYSMTPEGLRIDSASAAEATGLPAGTVLPLTLSLPGDANRGNAAQAVVAALALGADVKKSLTATENVQSVAGRYSTVSYARREVHLLLAKNPAGWQEALSMVDRSADGLVIATNGQVADGVDLSWLWDVRFENLDELAVVAAGERGADLAVRLGYAGVRHHLVKDALEAIRTCPPGRVEVLANYTAFRDLKRALDRAVAKDSKQNTADKEDTDAR